MSHNHFPSKTLPTLERLLCTKAATLDHLKQIHAQLITQSIKTPPLSILSKLIQQYYTFSSSQCNANLESNPAHLIFSQHQLQNDEILFLLNTLIKCSKPRDSILLFSYWVSKSTVVFDAHTYIFALGACARSISSTCCEGKQIHARLMKNGVISNYMVATTTIHFYASNGHIAYARKVFDEMPLRSIVTWNALMTGYCTQKRNAELNARAALILFKDMLVECSVLEPTDTTMVCVLSAVARLGMLEIGSSVHGYMEKTIFNPENDVYLGTGLVDMYSKCGCLDSASAVFYNMREKNVLTWTAVMTGLAAHGKGKETLELLDEMKDHNIKPNVVTVTSLFSACCHAGLIKEGLRLFYSMHDKFGFEPRIQHYGCIVDLLGRAGHLEEAYEFIVRMPIEPDPVLWRSLLSACNLHGDTKMAEEVGKILIQQQQLGPNLVNPGTSSEDYVALSNAYALAGKWKEAEMLREELKNKGMELKPGGSVC